MLVYIFPYIYEIIRGVVLKKNNSTSSSISILIVITYLLLPNVETFEIIFFEYFFIAISELKEKMEEKNV